MQTIDNYGGRDFLIKNVLHEPRKADNKSEKRKCWRRGFQSASKAKEKNLRSIPDQISGTMRRILLELLRELGGT